MRILGAPLLLAAAVGVPYAATNGPGLDSIWNQDTATSAPDARSTTGAAPGSQAAGMPGSGLGSYPGAGLQPIPLPQVLNFNVSKAWVYQRWDRKTTALSELDLDGVRVPLVTGTSVGDVAGSLTYYFDEQGQVQRIALVGCTGNTTQLEQLVTHHFGFQRQATPIAGQRLYQLKSGDKVFGELRLRPAAVIVSNDPFDSFAIDFQLQRPGTGTPLPKKQLVSVPLTSSAAQAAGTPQLPQAPAKSSVSAEKQASDESGGTFPPRSRIPKKQVDNLDRRGRFW